MFRRRNKLIFSVLEAVQHILILGRPGGGKTSGYMAPIQRQLLRLGARCLHCCVKPDEADRAAKLMPRAIRFSPTSGHVFNPFTYTMARKGARHLAMFHDELNEVLTRSTSDNTESFWKSGVTDLLIATFELVWLVRGKLATYQDCLNVIMNVPNNQEHAASEPFRLNPCGQMLEKALELNERKALSIADFLLKRLPTVGDKARGAFVTQAATSIQPFCVEPICNAVNGKSTLTPTKMVNGYTILDFDTLTYGINGLAFQLLVSWFCMEEVLARKKWKHPFMLVRDEWHQLAHARRDIQVMSVGRSQGFISLSAFQTIPVLEDALGAGIEAQTQAKALIGLHVNKVYCNSNCHITNEYASQSIGHERKMFFGGSAQRNPEQSQWHDVLGVGQAPNVSFNQQYHFRVDPLTYTCLRTGGKANKYLVDAIITRGTHSYEFHTTHQRKK